MKQENKWIYEEIEQAEYEIKMNKKLIESYANTISERAEQGNFQTVMELAQHAKELQWEVYQAESKIKFAKKYLEEAE